MQKKIIALAVAGLMSSAAFAQSNVTIYGAMRVSVNHFDLNTVNGDDWRVNDQASRIGFKGSEDLGGGLKAVWQWESQLNSTNANGVGSGVAPTYVGSGVNNNTAGFASQTQRNTFLGLSGGFGTVLFGTHDTPYKLGGSADLFGDTAADAQCSGVAGVICIIGRNGRDNRYGNVSAYISPTWSGFHFAAAFVAGESPTDATPATDADGLGDGQSYVAVYENGPLKATLGHEIVSKELGGSTNSTKGTKFNIAYKIGAIGLGYTHESSHDNATAAQLKDKGQLVSVSYAMGATTLGLQMGKFNDKSASNADDLSTWTVGAYHALSKRTQAYVGYHNGTLKNAGSSSGGDTKAKVLTMGLNHSF